MDAGAFGDAFFRGVVTLFLAAFLIGGCTFVAVPWVWSNVNVTVSVGDN